MNNDFATEIRDYLSLREILEDLELRIARCTSTKDEYRTELGAYLRRFEDRYKDEAWFKNLSLDKLKEDSKTVKDDKKKKDKKKGQPSTSSSWVPYMGLMISSTDQGEMEVFFEAIEYLELKLNRLTEAKKAVDELTKVGLGEDVKYRVYLKDGVPERLVLRPKDESVSRFAFNMVLSTVP